MEIRHHSSSGFTLIELLVVLVILGMLAGLVAPQTMRYLGSAKSDTARLQIEDLGTALDLFYLDAGRYPTTQEGLGVLLEPPVDGTHWNGPYIRQRHIPDDPWGNPYQYRSPGDYGPYDLFSHGENHTPGRVDSDRMITNWE